MEILKRFCNFTNFLSKAFTIKEVRSQELTLDFSKNQMIIFTILV